MAEANRRLDSEAQMQFGDFAPSMLAPCMLVGKAVPMRWGFCVPEGKRLVINARAETLWERPMFRDGVQKRRCLIPASRYYEWRKTDGCRHVIYNANAPLLLFAGLYRTDGTFVVVTTQAEKALQEIHPRMPLVMEDAMEGRMWLSSESAAVEIARRPCHMRGLAARPDEPEQIAMKF